MNELHVLLDLFQDPSNEHCGEKTTAAALYKLQRKKKYKNI